MSGNDGGRLRRIGLAAALAHWQWAPGQLMQVQAEVVGKFMKVSLEVEESSEPVGSEA